MQLLQNRSEQWESVAIVSLSRHRPFTCFYSTSAWVSRSSLLPRNTSLASESVDFVVKYIVLPSMDGLIQLIEGLNKTQKLEEGTVYGLSV